MNEFEDSTNEVLADSTRLKKLVPLSVGVSTTLLPLPAGLPLGGYVIEERGASDDNDCLSVRALVVESAGSMMVIISYDLLYASESLTSRLRSRINAIFKIPLNAILVCATHTHCAPRDITERTNASLVADLADAGLRAVTEAIQTMTPVRAISATTNVPGVAANRRDRHSLADDSAQLVLFEEMVDDEPNGLVVATLVNLACHPVVLDDNTFSYHPDFVGSLRECVENTVGGTCVFLQGFAGDTNPIILAHTIADARRVGGHAAGPIIAALTEMLCTGKTATVYNLSEGTEVPIAIREWALHSGSLSYVNTQVTVEQRSRDAEPDAGARPSAREIEEWISTLFKEQDEIFNSMDMTAANTGPISMEVQSMSIGTDLLIIGFPGEPFGEARQKIISALPGRRVLTVGYSNGTRGYIPSLDAYAESGYEVGCSIVAPGTLERLVATAVGQNA